MPVTLSASFGSGSTDAEILRCAQDDRQDTSQARSREVLSPNVQVALTLELAMEGILIYNLDEGT